MDEFITKLQLIVDLVVGGAFALPPSLCLPCRYLQLWGRSCWSKHRHWCVSEIYNINTFQNIVELPVGYIAQYAPSNLNQFLILYPSMDEFVTKLQLTVDLVIRGLFTLPLSELCLLSISRYLQLWGQSCRSKHRHWCVSEIYNINTNLPQWAFL